MNEESWPELRRALLEETEPVPGFEHRILSARAVPAPRRRSWAVVAAAAALAALVVATLLLAGRAVQRTAVPAAPPPAPSAPPPALSTRALSSPALDAGGAGWILEHAERSALPGAVTVVHTTDGGAHWTPQLDVAGYADLHSGPADQALVYVMGVSTGAGARPQDSIYSTTDAGAHWQRYSPPAPVAIGGVRIKDGHEAWVTTEVASAPSGIPDHWVVYHTVDGARTWQRTATVDLQATFGATNMGFSSISSGQYGIYIPRIGSAAPTRLYTTSDGGADWQPAPIPDLPGQAAGAASPVFGQLSDGEVVMIGQRALIVSEDGGLHWSSARPLPASPVTGGVRALDRAHWLLATSDGRVFASGDEGATWAAMGRVPRGMEPVEIDFVTPAVIWARASYLPPAAAVDALLTSTDGGRTWRSVPPPHPFRPAVPCGGAGAGVTAHAHLGVTYNGKERPGAVPAGVGLTDGCRYRLTTTDASGTIDIATAPGERGHVYTLGDFLDVWGVPDAAAVGGTFGSGIRVSVQVDGRPYAGDPRTVPLRDGTRVVVQVTGPPTGGG